MASDRPSLARLFVAAGGIYTAQSLVGGLTFLGVPAVLRAENVALDKIGMVSLAMLVWAVKFLWAPPVERLRLGTAGRRRSRALMLVGEAVVVLALLVFGFAAGADFSLILALLVIMALASATVDIVCDAFIIEQFPQEKRGLGNVAQVGGGYLGLIFGSGLFVALYSMAGWMAASVALAMLVVLMTIPMALTCEPAAAGSAHWHRHGDRLRAWRTPCAGACRAFPHRCGSFPDSLGPAQRRRRRGGRSHRHNGGWLCSAPSRQQAGHVCRRMHACADAGCPYRRDRL
jgi:MFS family permease